MFINLIKVLVVVISTLLYLKLVIRFISRKNQNLLIFPISFFYFFFILPIALDLIIGRSIPASRYYGFFISYKDGMTEFIYNVAILYSMFVYYFSFNKNKQGLNIGTVFKYKNIIFMLFLFIDFVILLTIVLQVDSDTLYSILTYDTRYLVKTNLLGVVATYSFVIGVVNVIPLLLEKNRNLFWKKLFLMLPFLIFICLCNGKKSIVFILSFALLVIIYTNKIIKKTSRYIFLSIVVLLSLLVYYNSYLDNVVTTKEYDSFQDKYDSYRVEFCRDDTLKMVIYDELYNDEKILSYRGESLLFYPTFFIRRENWNNKPYPYATYFTSKLLNLDNVKYVGWHMTTSIYDELVSNIGLFALIITPLLVCFIINKLNNFTNKSKLLDTVIKLLGTLLISLYFAVQINALLIPNLLFIALVVMKIFRDNIKIKIK